MKPLRYVETFTAKCEASKIINLGDQYSKNNVFSCTVENSTEPFCYVNKATFKINSAEDGLAWSVHRVDFTLLINRFSFNEGTIHLSSHDKLGQAFSFKVESLLYSESKITLRLIVHRVSTVAEFSYQLRDSLFAKELWDSAVNKERTDVEFTVDGKTFPAHRFILAARCPALAALVVAAESSPSSLTTINIDTMDPVAFEALLYFIYTGMIKTSTIDEPLLDAAKTFGMETLKLVALASGMRKTQLENNDDPELDISLE